MMKTTKQPYIFRQNMSGTKKATDLEMYGYLKAFPWLSIWGAALAIGGLLLVIFFASIEYLPDLDIKELTGMLAAIAIVGLYLVVVIGLGLILPSLFLKEEPGAKKWYSLGQACSGVLVATLMFLSFSFNSENVVQNFVTFVATASLLAALVSWLALLKINWKNWFICLLSMLLWALWSLMIPMLFYASLLNEVADENWTSYAMLFLFPLLFAVLSVAIGSIPAHQKGLARIVISILAVFLLGMFTNRPTFVPQTVMLLLGLSTQNKPVLFVLTETGCSSVNAALSDVICKIDEKSKLGTLTDARLISRIGKQMVIHWRPIQDADTQAKNPKSTQSSDKSSGKRSVVWKRVLIKKDDVVSWSYDYAMPATRVPSNTKANPP